MRGIRGLVATAIAVLALAALLLWLALPHPEATLPAAGQHLPAWALVGAFFVSELLVVRFWFRGDTHNFSLSGIPMLLGLVFSSPLVTLLTRLTGTAAATARRRRSLDKVGFNLSLIALETGVAAWTYRAVLGSASPVSPTGWLAGAVAVLAADVTSHAGVQAVIRLTSGPVSLAALATVLEVGAGLVVTTVALSLVATLVLSVDARAGVLLVLVAVVAALAYRSYGALRGRYAGLEVLYRFTDALAPIDGATDVAQVVLRQACELLRAGRAELTLVDGDSYLALSYNGADTALDRVTSTPEMIRVIGDGPGSLIGGGAAMLAPLRSGGSIVGAIRVSDRPADGAGFDDDDLRVFVALANHASVALQNGDLLEEIRRQAADSMYRALHDDLTGLGNRAHLVSAVDALLANACTGSEVAVMLMDLDGFKEVNDTLGHHAGDAVLRQVAASLASAEDHAVVARLGGDEFAVAVAGVPDSDAAQRVARQIVALVEQPVVADVAIDVRVSLGVALAPRHGTELTELLRKADIAMYAAKGSRSVVEVYSSDKDPHSARRLSLTGELRGAILQDCLDLHYQPKIDLLTGRIRGLEALVRWNHPEYGFVAPDEFIPIAEASGLMRPLTSWVLDRALTDLNSWAEPARDLTVAVNISARSLADGRLHGEVLDALREHHFDPSRLTLEITESSLMTQLERALHVLRGLAADGVQFSIDDFGTGYSSLAQLKGLPVHEVKIDKSFVIGMWNDGTDKAIIEVVLQLAEKLELRVVAEGVENVETFNSLRALGCPEGQGYYMARPMPTSTVPQWLASWKRPAVDALVVDDSRPFRTAMRWALEADGIAVVAEAEDGRRAIEQAARYQPRLVVLDLMMPNVSGLDALGYIRASAPTATVVAVSSADDPAAARACLRAGAVAHLDKALGPARLAERLAEICGVLPIGNQPALATVAS